jgi:hypothetical protein
MRTKQREPRDQTLPASQGLLPRKSGGFIQTFGLDYRVALLALLVDFIAFSGDIVSAGLLYPVELGGAVVLSFVTYKIQRSWYEDDRDSALIKAAIVGLLTAIPVPISWIVVGPGGLLGLLHTIFRRQ